MDHIDCIVVGAGVVGLAIGKKISEEGLSCLVLDSMPIFGSVTSSRNSEVIHAGIYYPEGSLKSLLCVRGKKLLYEFCEKKNVPYRACGKLIVATGIDELDSIESIKLKAFANGVDDLSNISGSKIRGIEPNVRALEGLFSPSTGIVDSHSLMMAYLADFEAHGGLFVGLSHVKRVIPNAHGFDVCTSTTDGDFNIQTKFLINAAGLGAHKLASSIDDFPSDKIPKLHLCKGTYFSIPGINLFSHLIYPIPPKRGDGLGIHATIDLGGNTKFGPDVEYVTSEDYDTDLERGESFKCAIRKYCPELDLSRLQPAYCGIRPKLQGPADGFRDFEINDGASLGFDGLVQLYGIESPGLTASLSLAEKVVDLVKS
tara:strand:+ start:8974 stop:10086 length:1113 start_codon:yes stop_codon:yes gene_type:complete